MQADEGPFPALPDLPPIRGIQDRLALLFPEEFPDRGILVGEMAARVVFVFLYGGFIEGSGRLLRPSNIYLFTGAQANKTGRTARLGWISESNRPGFRMRGKRWYADTSREPIRDDLIRNQLIRLGIVQRRPGIPITSSFPAYSLSQDFARLFDPTLAGEALIEQIRLWRERHLDIATRQRMALRAQGVEALKTDLYVDLPDGARIRIAAGPSSLISKGLIEEFASRHLERPVLVWLSVSDKKIWAQYAELAGQVGLKFDAGSELPDVILADMGSRIRFLFCEVVATDGAVTEARREALLAVVRESNVPEENVQFLSAFEDRESPSFRKNFSRLALGSFVWFRTEPNLLVILSAVKEP